MDFRAPLNDRQLDVLRWIVHGCPEGVMEGHLHKHIAIALQDRKLVKISKGGGTWRAIASDAGRHYVEHGSYPEGLWTSPQSPPRPVLSPTAPPRHPRPPTPAEPKSGTSGAGPEITAHASRRSDVPPKRRPVTEQLIADVIAAGGELRVNADDDKINYDQRVAAAIRHGKVPEGKLLIIERGKTWRDRIIRLQDPPEWMTAVLAPIPVSATLRKPHKVVAALKADEDLLQMTAQVRARACRLVQALVGEAERRGYTVRHNPRTSRTRRHHQPSDGLLTVTISGHTFGVDLQQQFDRVEHVPTAGELRRAERDSWYRIPTHDAKTSGRIAISITNGRQYRQSTWSDGARSHLEGTLPQVLQELELRAGFAEQQRLANERKRAEEQRQWEIAMARAQVESAKTTAPRFCRNNSTIGRRHSPWTPTWPQCARRSKNWKTKPSGNPHKPGCPGPNVTGKR